MKAILIASLGAMIPRLIFVACLVGCLSGCKEPPKPSKEPGTPKLTQYQLSVSKNFESEPFSKPYANWKKSLLKNLGYSESKISSRDFLITDLILSADGKPSGHRVYVSREDPRLFLIPEIGVLISFDENIVGTMGVEGISRHLTHDKNFAVLIHPSGGRHFLGVPVGNLKTESPEPEFQGKQSVTFHR